jgi:hypothetical protein
VVIGAASLGVALLAGCAGGTQGPGQSLPATGGERSSRAARSGLEPSGIAYQFIALQFPPVPQVRPSKNGYKGFKDLFVSDLGNGAVELLKNGSYTPDKTITAGVDGPYGTWLDKKGNFYLANFAGGYITEYAPKKRSVEFTYTDNVAIAVSTDSVGNVYAADDGGYVNEYPQGSNSVTNSCRQGGSETEGVAIDKNGNVFVDYENFNADHAYLVEYKGGLNGCNGTVLGVTLKSAGGIVLDKNNDLVVCDRQARVVYVIAPPYNSVSRTLVSPYFSDPLHVTLSKDNTTAFVADRAAVYVFNYNTGSITATLGSANGLSKPTSAVDGPNYVP